jgi:hypothetical protein
MALSFLRHKWQKVTLICFAVLLVLALAAGLFLAKILSPVLASKVKSAVLKGSDSLYYVTFSSAELRLIQGKILFYNVKLDVDTNVYKRLKKSGIAPNNLIELRLKRLVLTDIHPFKFYFKKIIDIGSITLNAPDVQISYHQNKVKDTLLKDERTLWQKISKSLKYVHVGDIFLNDVKLKHTDYSGKNIAVSELKEFNLHTNELLIDSLTQTDTTRFLYCKEIIADLNNYKGNSPDGLYSYGIKRAKFSTRTKQLKVQGFALDPTANYFAKTHKIRYKLKLDSIVLNNFDFMMYHKSKSFSASELTLKKGSFDIFANPNGLKIYKDKIKSFPHVALFQAGVHLKLDSLKIRQLDISYTEYNKKSDREGTISFNRTNADFLNITTDSLSLAKNNLLTAHITSHFMDKARLNVDFNFNLTDDLATFTYKGRLSPMNLRALNQATIPLAMVKINSGLLKSLDFDFKANRNVFKGKVTLLYNDLTVSVLKNDEFSQELRKKLIVSIFANLFILKHNNPDNPGEIPRSFSVNYKRPIDHPFFKSIWKSMLMGIKPAVGFDEKTQKTTTARMAEEKLKKTNRQIRKEKRQAKRAAKKRRKEAEKRQKITEENKKKAEENKKKAAEN